MGQSRRGSAGLLHNLSQHVCRVIHIGPDEQMQMNQVVSFDLPHEVNSQFHRPRLGEVACLPSSFFMEVPKLWDRANLAELDHRFMGRLGVPMVPIQNAALPHRPILPGLDGSRWGPVDVIPPRKLPSLPRMGLVITGNPWFIVLPFFKLFVINRLTDHLHRSRTSFPLATVLSRVS